MICEFLAVIALFVVFAAVGLFLDLATGSLVAALIWPLGSVLITWVCSINDFQDHLSPLWWFWLCLQFTALVGLILGVCLDSLLAGIMGGVIILIMFCNIAIWESQLDYYMNEDIDRWLRGMGAFLGAVAFAVEVGIVVGLTMHNPGAAYALASAALLVAMALCCWCAFPDCHNEEGPRALAYFVLCFIVPSATVGVVVGLTHDIPAGLKAGGITIGGIFGLACLIAIVQACYDSDCDYDCCPSIEPRKTSYPPHGALIQSAPQQSAKKRYVVLELDD